MNVQASIKAERVAGIIMRLESSGIRVSSVGHLVRLGLEALEERFGEAYEIGPGAAVDYLQRYGRGGLLGRSLRLEDRRSLGLEAAAQTRQELSAPSRPRFQLSPEALEFARRMGFQPESVEADPAERSEAPGDSLDVDRTAGEAPGVSGEAQEP